MNLMGFNASPWESSFPSQISRFFAAEVSHDRSTAHFAAWYSPKREAQHMGQKFQPEASGDGKNLGHVS